MLFATNHDNAVPAESSSSAICCGVELCCFISPIEVKVGQTDSSMLHLHGAVSHGEVTGVVVGTELDSHILFC